MSKERLLLLLRHYTSGRQMKVDNRILPILFSYKTRKQKDATFYTLRALAAQDLICMYECYGNEKYYNINAIYLTDTGLLYLSDQIEARRSSRTQFRHALVSGSFSTLLGVILGWVLSYITLN